MVHTRQAAWTFAWKGVQGALDAGNGIAHVVVHSLEQLHNSRCQPFHVWDRRLIRRSRGRSTGALHRSVTTLSWGGLDPALDATDCYCVDDQTLIFGRDIVDAVFDETAWLAAIRGIEQSADGWGWTRRRDYKQTCVSPRLNSFKPYC